MAQNITLLGANYSAVPGVLLPKTGGGSALFSDQSITTAVAADVAQGKQFLLADGSIGTGTASGGGGNSRCVVGTFTGTTKGQALTVNVPYTGNGVPISIIIFPSEGGYNRSSGTFHEKIQRYAIQMWTASRNEDVDTNFYTTGTQCVAMVSYKSSTSSSSSYQRTGSNTVVVFNRNGSPSASATDAVKMTDSKTMKVFIANTSYGFMDNIEYTYVIAYTS